MVAGRSEETKRQLAEGLTEAVTGTLGCSADSVSVAIEDVAQSDWTDRVYVPDIQANPTQIYKKPGYDPFA